MQMNLKFLVKKGDGEFSVVHTVNINNAGYYTHNYLANEPGTFTLKVIAQKWGINYEATANQIVVQETFKMRFKTLKEGDVFNTRKKVNMHVECSH